MQDFSRVVSTDRRRRKDALLYSVRVLPRVFPPNQMRGGVSPTNQETWFPTVGPFPEVLHVWQATRSAFQPSCHAKIREARHARHWKREWNSESTIETLQRISHRSNVFLLSFLPKSSVVSGDYGNTPGSA